MMYAEEEAVSQGSYEEEMLHYREDFQCVHVVTSYPAPKFLVRGA